MITTPNFTAPHRSAYPGEYTPNPFIFERIKDKSHFNVKSAIFSNVIISEDAKYFQIELDTPGLRREDFLVRINERGNLSISGIQKEETGIHKEDSGIHFDDYTKPAENYSGFSREFPLPANLDTDFVRAHCRSGVLTIWFLKTEKAYHKRPSMVVVY